MGARRALLVLLVLAAAALAAPAPPEPSREPVIDLQLGAAPCGEGICVFMKTDEPYEGRLQFDVPRHRIISGFQQDWPRMNAVPEWFSVEPDEAHHYEVEDVDSGSTRVVSGKSLSEGLRIRLEPGKSLRLVVLPRSERS